MSTRPLTLVELELGRYAFPFTPCMVRGVIPQGRAGVYLLLKDGAPIYVGRSDSCTRNRLIRHPLLGCASHFSWQPCRDAGLAYHMEAFWYHALLDQSLGILNRAHPARPRHTGRTCPFCNEADR